MVMNPLVIGSIVFACALGGALIGNWLRTVLPAHHLDGESRDSVKVGIGLIATMTALVLGLVTASAKSSFEAVNTMVRTTAIEILTLDRALARYGPDTGEIRSALRDVVASRVETIWPEASSQPPDLDPLSSGAASRTEAILGRIRTLTPRNDMQKALQARAADLGEKLLQARWLIIAGMATSVPLPFLVILVFWLTFTFVSFGLFAPRNETVRVVLFVCALSIGSAVFLILELDGPFDGLLRVSPGPMRYVLSHMNQ